MKWHDLFWEGHLGEHRIDSSQDLINQHVRCRISIFWDPPRVFTPKVRVAGPTLARVPGGPARWHDGNLMTRWQRPRSDPQHSLRLTHHVLQRAVGERGYQPGRSHQVLERRRSAPRAKPYKRLHGRHIVPP